MQSTDGRDSTGVFGSVQRLVKGCKFDNFLEPELRDRLVCGLASEIIRKEPLKEKDLVPTDACEKASAIYGNGRNG